MAENAANGTVVGRVTGTDPDAGDTKTYTLTDSAGGRFAINRSTGVLTVANGRLLNYEAATSHTVTVRVTDRGGLTYTEAFQINLTDVNEAVPTITSDGGGTTASINVAENTTAVTTVTATDADTRQTLTYSISGGADAAKFAINSSTGALSFITAPDYEAPTDSGGNNVYDVMVQVSDGNGRTDTQTIAVTVTNANETPTDLSLSANTVAENAANGTVVGTVNTADPDRGDTQTYTLIDTAGGRFAIDSSTGVITVADGTLLDYENTPSHDVTVRVTDSGGLTYTEAFQINLTDVNEAPSGANATVTLNEDTAHTLAAANFGFSDVDAGDSLSAVRIDTLPAAGSLTLSGVAVRAGQVVTVADITAGNLVFTPAANANGTGYARVTFSVRDSNSAYDTTPNTLTFNVTAVNDAPTDLSLSANTVAENAANGTVVGRVTGTDPDAGDTKTYTLTDSAGGRFAINRSTGVLTVANGTLLNYEAATSHTITVRVMDMDGLTYDKSFTITLTDMYEPLPPPNVPGSMASHSMATRENGTALFPLQDASSETVKAEFGLSEDSRKAIDITIQTSLPIDTANREETHLGALREEFVEKRESTEEGEELLPASIGENQIEGKITAQDPIGSALRASDRVDIQEPDRTSEGVIGTTMTVGLAGVVLQGAVGTKEKLIANIRRPRNQAEGTSLDSKSELSSGDDSRSPKNESGDEGSVSNKPGPT